MPREPRIELPPSELLAASDAPAVIADLADRYRDLDGRLVNADRLKAEAERAVLAAEEADIVARAEALEADKPVPTTSKKIDQAKRRRDEQTREVAALEQARANVRRKLEQAVAEHAAEYHDALDTQAGDWRHRFGELLDELARVHGELTERLALRGWIAGDANGAVPGRWLPGRHGGRLRSLTAASGDPLTPGQALAALREIAEPPAPAVPKREPRPLRPVPRAA